MWTVVRTCYWAVITPCLVNTWLILGVHTYIIQCQKEGLITKMCYCYSPLIFRNQKCLLWLHSMLGIIILQ